MKTLALPALLSAALVAAACTNHSAVKYCVEGESCSPANACKLGALSCATSSCEELDAGVADGTACDGGVCSAGACSVCPQGAACAPAGNPCHAGTVDCGTGQPLCSDTLAPGNEGASCGTDLICAAGSCGPGDGVDLSPTIAGSERMDLVHSAATGATGATTLTVGSSVGFLAGQLLLVHQTVGAGAGKFEEVTVSGVASPTALSLAAPLRHSYVTGAQALIVRRFTSLTIPAGATLTASPWNGSVGGILTFKVHGALRVDGKISVAAVGYRGGAAASAMVDYDYNQQGEGSSGSGPARANTNDAANASGGGAGCGQGSGGGGGYGSAGAGGQASGCTSACAGTAAGQGGLVEGTADLGAALLGGGGGASGSHSSVGSGVQRDGAAGGAGGGLFVAHAGSLTVTAAGSIDADGIAGVDGYTTTGTLSPPQPIGGGGGGAGGALKLTAGSIELAGLVTALGGSGGATATGGVCTPSGLGGRGGDGRIYLSSPHIAGNTSPAATEGTTP